MWKLHTHCMPLLVVWRRWRQVAPTSPHCHLSIDSWTNPHGCNLVVEGGILGRHFYWMLFHPNLFLSFVDLGTVLSPLPWLSTATNESIGCLARIPQFKKARRVSTVVGRLSPGLVRPTLPIGNQGEFIDGWTCSRSSKGIRWGQRGQRCRHEATNERQSAQKGAIFNRKYIWGYEVVNFNQIRWSTWHFLPWEAWIRVLYIKLETIA